MKLNYFLFIILITQKSQSFGPKGHYIVARVAEKYLEKHNPEALEKLNTILNSITTFQKSEHHPFVEAASYLDDIKGIHWKIFNNWHYDNTPYIPTAAKKKIKKEDIDYEKQNIVWAINELKSALRNTTLSKVNDYLAKSFSLNQLIHFVGDIHQPLHTITRIDPDTLKSDKGGNDFKIKYVGSGGNLHSFWDKCLKMFPELNRLEAPFSQENWQKLDKVATQLINEFPEKSLVNDLNETSVRAWQKENYKIAVKFAYANLTNGQEISEQYLNKARPQLRRLMTLGGYRLGKILDDIYQESQTVFELHLKVVHESVISEQVEGNSQDDSREEDYSDLNAVERAQKQQNKKNKKQQDSTYEPSVEISEEQSFEMVFENTSKRNGLILKNTKNQFILELTSILLLMFQLIQ